MICFFTCFYWFVSLDFYYERLILAKKDVHILRTFYCFTKTYLQVKQLNDLFDSQMVLIGNMINISECSHMELLVETVETSYTF